MRRLARRDEVADTPAGHRVGLRAGEDADHGAVGARGRAHMRAVEDERLVRLVGDEPEQSCCVARLDERGQRLAPLHRSGGVRRGVDDDRPREGRERALDGGDVEAEARVAVEGIPPRGRADERGDRRVPGPPRVGHEHLVAGIGEHAQQRVEPAAGARRHDDLVRAAREAVHRPDAIRDRLTQRRKPHGGRVVSEALRRCPQCRLDDVRRRREVRVAELEPDGVRSCERTLEHLADRGTLDVRERR